MNKTSKSLGNVVNLIGVFGIIKGFFGDERKMAKLYRVLVGGLIAYIVARTAYMSYRLFRFGCVKEVRRRVDDAELIDEYEPDSSDKEYYDNAE